MFNVWNGLTNGTLVVPIFQEATTKFSPLSRRRRFDGGVRTPADGIVYQKHGRWDRSAVGCLKFGGFDLRHSIPHDGDGTSFVTTSATIRLSRTAATATTAIEKFLGKNQKGPNRKDRAKARTVIQLAISTFARREFLILMELYIGFCQKWWAKFWYVQKWLAFV